MEGEGDTREERRDKIVSRGKIEWTNKKARRVSRNIRVYLKTVVISLR